MRKFEGSNQDRSDRGISRRDVVIGGASLGIAAPLLAGTMARPARAAAKRGGTLHLGMTGGGSTDSMDPGTSNAPVSCVNDFLVYNCLVEIDRQKKLVPELAESWEAKPGAKEWVFKLRKGVAFHNGKSVEADDVVYSLNRHRGPGTKSLGAAFLSQVSDIKADGKDTVILTLGAGNADLPAILAAYFFGIVPKDFQDWPHPIGSGPFVMKTFEAGVQTIAERNPNYWKPDRAWFDRVELTVINDPTARLNALLTGKIDTMNRVDRRTVNLLGSSPAIRVVRSSGGLHYSFSMDCNVKEFADNNVRLALKHGIDREQMLNSIIQGFGKLGNDQPLASSDPYYDASLPQRKFDPDKARFYLKQAGLSTLKVPFSTSTNVFQEAIDAAVLFAQSAKQAGIEIDVIREPADGYFTNVWKKKPFFASYWSGEATADLMFSRAYKSDSPQNESNWKNDNFDKILLEARVELDDARRKSLYAELQRLVNEDGGAIIPVFADFIDATKTTVKGFEPNPTRELDGYRMPERAWFES